MDEKKFLAARFEEQRPRLRAVAYRMLGSLGEAEDAVQEAWLRLERTGEAEIEELDAWLTTVVARIALNVLRSRKKRAETHVPDPIVDFEATSNPEHEALFANSLGLALLVVLETLGPAERVAFVLHDVFGRPFEEIAPILGRNVEATRQLASRGRRRVQDRRAVPDVDLAAQRTVVDAFVAASRDGDFQGLLAVLDPHVILRTDVGAPAGAGSLEVRGANEVASRARSFSRLGFTRQSVVVNGVAGLLCFLDGKPFSLMAFTVRGGRITEIDIVADPKRVAAHVAP